MTLIPGATVSPGGEMNKFPILPGVSRDFDGNPLAFTLAPVPTGVAPVDTAALTAALSRAAGKTLDLAPGAYALNNQLTVTASGTTIQGAGMYATTIQGGITSGASFAVQGVRGTPVVGVTIQDLTIDCQNNASASGFLYNFTSHVTLRRVRFINVAFKDVQFASDGTYLATDNNDLLFEGCIFSGVTSTPEIVTIADVTGCRFVRCLWTNFGTIGVLLYQLANSVVFDDCIWTAEAANTTGVVYSLSCNDITFDHCHFLGATGTNAMLGISGANQSDHGAFSATVVVGLHLVACHFVNVQQGYHLGAVLGFSDVGSLYNGVYYSAVYVSNGNSPVNAAPTDLTWQACTFLNCGQGGAGGVLSAGIGFSNPLGGSPGPELRAEIADCHFIDNQGGHTMDYGVGIDGNGTAGTSIFSGIHIHDCTSSGLVVGMVAATSAASFSATCTTGNKASALAQANTNISINTTASYSTVVSMTFTPVGSVVNFMAGVVGINNTATVQHLLRVAVGSTHFPLGSTQDPASNVDFYMGGTGQITGLVPNVQVTVVLELELGAASTFQCRAGSFPTNDAATLLVQDA